VLPVEILGINQPGNGVNDFMFKDKPCSWIRDNTTPTISAAWAATYRDVFILDPLNGKIEKYSLTVHDLQTAANRAELKSKLIAAATPVDADGDRIPDYWETNAAGGTGTGPLQAAPNGEKLLHYYALCGDARTGQANGLSLVPDSGGVTVRCIRRRGVLFGLTVTPEFSTDLINWTPGSGFGPPALTTLYDGSGGEMVEWRSTALPVPGTQYVRLAVAVP